MAATFTFPAEVGDGFFDGFGNAIVASAEESGSCGSNLTWTLDDNGTLTISGSGAMDDFLGNPPWEFCRDHIRSVNIKPGVTSIENHAFSGCTSLTSISVDENNSNYCSYKGVLFNKDKTTLVAYPDGKGDDYVIPNGVTSIGDSAFYGCTRLTRITIPDSVSSIEDRAFLDCESLISITVNDSITSIGDYAFCSCSNLTSVTLPDNDNFTSIGEETFSWCPSLTSITIPDSVTSIGVHAFFRSDNLTSIFLPEASIGYTKALGRGYDIDGLNSHKNGYINDRDLYKLAFDFIFSPEYLEKNLSDEDFVENMYEVFLDRSSDPAGKADWLDRMANQGYTREDVLAGFVGSQECADMVAGFGI